MFSVSNGSIYTQQPTPANGDFVHAETPHTAITHSLSNVSVYYVVGHRIVHGSLKKLPEEVQSSLKLITGINNSNWTFTYQENLTNIEVRDR